ncbi:MAG TPA: lysine biosynthesis protein LysX, partial [Candidatus Binatus sp.]|nr:lysine biosynthesis protein LysX [Candidatus Binatus sp.]
MGRITSTSLGLVYDQIRPDERMIIDAARKSNVALQFYNTNTTPFPVTGYANNGLELSDVVLQRCVSYFRGLHVTATLEANNILVVNSFEALATAGNKLLASIRLAKAGVPTPKTFVAFTEDSAVQALDKLGYPAVIKPVVGSWGRLVALIKDPEMARSIIEPREYLHPIQQVYYLQEKIDRPGRDIRAFVIGDTVVAAMYRYAGPTDWRTNAALGGKIENCPVTTEIEDLSVRSAKAMGGGAFGVDLMESKKGLVVHE